MAKQNVEQMSRKAWKLVQEAIESRAATTCKRCSRGETVHWIDGRAFHDGMPCKDPPCPIRGGRYS